MERKLFLKRFMIGATSVPAILAACQKEDAIAAGTTTSTGNSTTSGSSNSDCAVTPTETAGPFPTKNPSSLVNGNIVGDRTGVAMSMNITVKNTNNNCAVLEGAIVDVWHCDKDGYYSEYGGSGMQSANFQSVHFLRGRQTTDSNGSVKFTSIFPGWYNGRATHIHVHIYSKTGQSLLITQIAFPEGATSAVNIVNTQGASQGYTKGMSGYTYNASDNVFRDGVSLELASVTGSMDKGFELVHSIYVAG